LESLFFHFELTDVVLSYLCDWD